MREKRQRQIVLNERRNEWWKRVRFVHEHEMHLTITTLDFVGALMSIVQASCCCAWISRTTPFLYFCARWYTMYAPNSNKMIARVASDTEKWSYVVFAVCAMMVSSAENQPILMSFAFFFFTIWTVSCVAGLLMFLRRERVWSFVALFTGFRWWCNLRRSLDTRDCPECMWGHLLKHCQCARMAGWNWVAHFPGVVSFRRRWDLQGECVFDVY